MIGMQRRLPADHEVGRQEETPGLAVNALSVIPERWTRALRATAAASERWGSSALPTRPSTICRDLPLRAGMRPSDDSPTKRGEGDCGRAFSR
jgi:hypothetical protein